MQHRESTQIKVGIFIFFAILMAMLLLLFLGSEKQLFKSQYHLVTYFEDISGLRVGAQVQLAGLSVGMVDQINLSQDLKDKRVEVRLSINREFQERIRKDSLASINTQGLLGDKIISVSIGTPAQQPLQDNEWLPSEERPSLFSIAEKGGAIMENVNNAAKSVSNVLKEVETGQGLVHTLLYESKERPVAQNVSDMIQELKLASKEIHEAVQKVNRGEGTIGALLSDPSVYNDIRRLFGKLERNALLRHIIRSRIRDLELEKASQKTKKNK